MGDFIYNPTGGSFTGVLPMKSVASLSYLNSIEDCWRYKGDAGLGAYYPVRVAPSVEIDDDAEWPIIMPAGTIVSILSLKDTTAYAAADTEAGINISGLVYVSQSAVDGTALSKSINYLYDKEVAGLITICNGGTETNDLYTADCGTYGILNISGAVPTAGDVYTRAANYPMGVVGSRIPADLRLRYLNYDALNSVSPANAIFRSGVLTIPYVMIVGSGTRATVLTAIRTAVNAKHQYLWAQDASSYTAYVASGKELKADAYGKFTNWESGSHSIGQLFAKVLETRNRVPYNIDEIIDSFPGSGMKGMDTGGLKARLFNFIKSIITATNIKTGATTGSIADVKAALTDGYVTATSDVTVYFGQVDVAFGTLK